MLDKATQDQISKMFVDALKPIGERIAKVEEGQTAIGTRIEKVEKSPVMRVDASGNPIPFGKDGVAIVRKDSLGDRPYSVANVARALLEKDEKYATMELEVSRVLKNMGYPHSHDGAVLVPMGLDYLPDMGQQADNLRKLLKDAFWIPDFDPAEMRAVAKSMGMARFAKVMDPLTDTQGGSLMPYPERGELIELLRSALVCAQAGARMVPLPPGGLDYPTETGQTSFQWRKLGVQADINESTPTTGSVKLGTHELAGLSKVPNSLIRFSRPAAEALVRRSLTADAALAADLGYIEGQGGTSPVGLLIYPRSVNNTPTPGQVTLHVAGVVGGTGDTFTPEDVQTMLALIEEANDQEGATAWALRPLFFSKIANMRAGSGFAASDGQGPFMFPVTRGALSGSIQKEMGGIKVVTSTQISKTRQKGGAVNLTYAIAANWRRMVIGVVGALEIAVSTEAGFARNETWFRAVLYTDSALTLPQSFVVCDTLVP